MTAAELRKWVNDFSNKHGIEKPLPDHLEVNNDTYSNICQHIFDNHKDCMIDSKGNKLIQISIGPNNGILFKGMELILKNGVKDDWQS